jgi:hypothetical protein
LIAVRTSLVEHATRAEISISISISIDPPAAVPSRRLLRAARPPQL